MRFVFGEHVRARQLIDFTLLVDSLDYCDIISLRLAQRSNYSLPALVGKNTAEHKREAKERHALECNDREAKEREALECGLLDDTDGDSWDSYGAWESAA